MSSNTSSSSSLVSTAAYTGPRAPVVLEDEYDNRRPSCSRAFLSKTPAAGSSIQVQPHPREYQIWVRLPGFTSDGIIVTTQKERVVHIVADKWDNNGGQFQSLKPSALPCDVMFSSLMLTNPFPGHFERRILFDYDADLSKDSSVKAKFRDDWLCVTVRRHSIPCFAPS